MTAPRLDAAREALRTELMSFARRFDQLTSKPALLETRDDIKRQAANIRLVAALVQSGVYSLDLGDSWLWAVEKTYNHHIALREGKR